MVKISLETKFHPLVTDYFVILYFDMFKHCTWSSQIFFSKFTFNPLKIAKIGSASTFCTKKVAIAPYWCYMFQILNPTWW